MFQSIGWGIFDTVTGLVGRIVLVRDRVRARLRTPLFLLASAVISILVGRSLSQIMAIQTAIDMYVSPRAITRKQADDLRGYLSRHESSAVTVNVVPNDQEANEYAAELVNALRQTDWDINPPNHSGPLPWQRSSDVGLCINVELIEDPLNVDPKHPTPDAVLRDAFRAAKIEANCGEGTPNKGKYSISIVVGHRPMAIGKQSWIHDNIEGWFVN